MKVTVWNEFRHEREHEEVRSVYPNGIHEVIAEFLQTAGFEVGTATLDEPEHGLTEDVLSQTDVLVWWGHMAHHEVSDRIVDRIHQRVLDGMGLIVLHSGHFSKIFKKLMGTSCDLKWREAGENERLWVVNPNHPIVQGIGETIELEHEEMYGEHFDIPAPDELVLVSWFKGGEVFRSGCVFNRGQGKIFYFRPGHETFPTYYQEPVQKVITNAARYVAPVKRDKPVYGNAQPLESL
ncbi:ThuA domain-containing protein [Pullulanibacillus sp. KACC 23026]|uniref:ThuA domain-containing protein n=1 Tax=Pullulanibacillus sp. KACC 23026 TaxID=3028315 RepID=UPI0023B16F38|nr:ThuA domain-containing protein [Pullulanibacillus sp. KACC 23026]WEG13050.1 ThuA domain-containing protein [Pullulanibacillus sp. KACC 23026]